MITVAIVLPIVTGFGFDPIRFGVVAMIVIGMGRIRLLVGPDVFVVRGVAGNMPHTTTFRRATHESQTGCSLPVKQ